MAEIENLDLILKKQNPNFDCQFNEDVDEVVVVVVKTNEEITGMRKKSKKSCTSSSSSDRRPKREKREETGLVMKSAQLLREPIGVFGSDIMLMILNKLDAQGVALCLLVSHDWNQLASSDSLWNKKCKELWLGKVHVPRCSPRLSWLAAYSFSIMDAKRTRITKADLCDHIWEFRFKKEAPDYWLNLDPSWTGIGPPMLRYFHPDGSQSADPDDQVWGGHECAFSTVTSFVGDGSIRDHYVRINRWPPMSVSRTQNWGWELGNKIYWYSSTPDANKEGGTGPLFPVW